MVEVHSACDSRVASHISHFAAVFFLSVVARCVDMRDVS